MTVVATQREVAEHFDVTTWAVLKWKKKGMPGEKGAYDLDKIKIWRDKTNRRKKDEVLDFEGEDANKTESELRQGETLRSRKLLAEVERVEALARIEQEKARRIEDDNLVELDSVENFLATFLTNIRRRLMRLPESVVGTVPEDHRKDLRETLDAKIQLELRQVVNDLKRTVELIRDDD